MSRRVCGLYAITPDEPDDEKLAAQVDAAVAGGARVVQYRNKSAEPDVRRRQALTVQIACRRRGAVLIINDDARLAFDIGADGVHLGSEDGSVADARAKLGRDAIIGASCYNALEAAHRAVREGASYVAFGSFFPSAVKPDAVRAPLALLREAKRHIIVPVIAIGGIDADNAPQVIAAGADGIAVISALFAAPDVGAAARQLSGLFSTGRGVFARRKA